jgi:hypothetical protein
MMEVILTRPERRLSPRWFEIEVVPVSRAVAYAVEEEIPDGLLVLEVMDGGVVDEIQNKLKWGPFFDNEVRTFRYSIEAINQPTTFSGVVSVDGTGTEISGDLWRDPARSIFVNDQDPGEAPRNFETALGTVFLQRPDWIFDFAQSRWLYLYGESAQSYFLNDPLTGEWIWTSESTEGWYYRYVEPIGWHKR